MQSPVPFRSRKLRVVLGRILLLSDSREAEFEGRSMCYRCLRRFMGFLFWLAPTAPPNPISALLLVSGNEPPAICAIPCASISYPPVKRPRVCYANALSEIPSMVAFFRCPRADTPAVRNPFLSCGLPCDSFRSIDTTNECRCRENWSPE